jgi:hypothetical protein
LIDQGGDIVTDEGKILPTTATGHSENLKIINVH